MEVWASGGRGWGRGMARWVGQSPGRAGRARVSSLGNQQQLGGTPGKGLGEGGAHELGRIEYGANF